MNKDQEIEKLKKETVNLQEQIVNLDNSWKRALADYQNLEKRVKDQKEEWINFSTANILHKLLNIFDGLEKAEAHLKDEGLKIIINQVKELLQNEGVVEIEALGKTFDPNLHECLEKVPSASGSDNTIIYIFNKGYKLRNRLLRPAKVKVSYLEKRKE